MTILSDVEKLMNGMKADLLITDPPYNVDYEGKTKDKLKIENDKMNNDSFRQFLMPLKNGKSDNIEDAEDLQSFSGANMTVEQALIMAQVKKAAKGDLNAFEAIRDLIGEKVTKSEVSVQSNNPFEGLSTEELKKLIDDDKE